MGLPVLSRGFKAGLLFKEWKMLGHCSRVQTVGFLSIPQPGQTSVSFASAQPLGVRFDSLPERNDLLQRRDHSQIGWAVQRLLSGRWLVSSRPCRAQCGDLPGISSDQRAGFDFVSKERPSDGGIGGGANGLWMLVASEPRSE